jgi:hypothetical protein
MLKVRDKPATAPKSGDARSKLLPSNVVMKGVHAEISRSLLLFHTAPMRRFTTVSEASTSKAEKAEPNFPLSRAFFFLSPSFFFFYLYPGSVNQAHSLKKGVVIFV